MHKSCPGLRKQTARVRQIRTLDSQEIEELVDIDVCITQYRTQGANWNRSSLVNRHRHPFAVRCPPHMQMASPLSLFLESCAL